MLCADVCLHGSLEMRLFSALSHGSLLTGAFLSKAAIVLSKSDDKNGDKEGQDKVRWKWSEHVSTSATILYFCFEMTKSSTSCPWCLICPFWTRESKRTPLFKTFTKERSACNGTCEVVNAIFVRFLSF